MYTLCEKLFKNHFICHCFFQKEEREKATQKKTNEALEGIQKSIQDLTSSMTSKPSGKVENSLATSTGSIDKKLDATDAKIESVKKEIENLKNSLSKVSCDNCYFSIHL